MKFVLKIRGISETTIRGIFIKVKQKSLETIFGFHRNRDKNHVNIKMSKTFQH